MERQAAQAGATFQVRSGWNVAVAYPTRADTGWADVSHIPNYERVGPHDLEPGRAVRRGGAWWCPISDRRSIVIGGDVESEFEFSLGPRHAALAVLGPVSRELISRFCAIDLRPQHAPPGSFRPGAIARQPGMILCEDHDRYRLIFGWAVAEYMWAVVEDAGRPLGATPMVLLDA
jgi:glycine cleavage system aminomethyltransferase T